jgi:hypothetical protein|tara:strand:- start:134 stop:721 length:588 start_codon:yes stop_codon:yes gene_type:complete
MTDPEIRHLLIRHLLFARLARRKSFSENQLCEEVPIQNGLTRADVVFCGSRLECFEIKSHRDTLKRLFSQGWQYEQSFDRVTLVCATKHLNKAFGIIPKWWGVLEVSGSGQLHTVRTAQSNPHVNISGMADLLENQDARAILQQSGITKGIGRMHHEQLRKTIAEHLTLSQLREATKKALTQRQLSRWRPSEQVA